MKIKCNAIKCIFNDNEECFNKQINIEGLFARAKIGTFCNSYKKREESADKLEKRLSRVICDSSYCKYFKDGYCVCEELNIYGDDANYRSETQCNSFKLK